MIELDRTDEEREELVKEWIRDYWKVIAGAVALAIGLAWSISLYRQSKINALRETGAQMEQVFTAIGEKKTADALKTAQALQDDEEDTSFSTLATFGLAKQYFEEGKYKEAIEQYDWLIKNADDIAIRDVSRLRKARAQANGKHNDKAIETLGALEGQSFIFEANLLKGDLYAASQQYDKAKQSYESLINEESLKQIIKQRLDLLTIKQQQNKL